MIKERETETRYYAGPFGRSAHCVGSYKPKITTWTDLPLNIKWWWFDPTDSWWCRPDARCNSFFEALSPRPKRRRSPASSPIATWRGAALSRATCRPRVRKTDCRRYHISDIFSKTLGFQKRSTFTIWYVQTIRSYQHVGLRRNTILIG